MRWRDWKSVVSYWKDFDVEISFTEKHYYSEYSLDREAKGWISIEVENYFSLSVNLIVLYGNFLDHRWKNVKGTIELKINLKYLNFIFPNINYEAEEELH